MNVGQKVVRTSYKNSPAWLMATKRAGIRHDSPVTISSQFMCSFKGKRVAVFEGITGSWPTVHFTLWETPTPSLESLL